MPPLPTIESKFLCVKAEILYVDAKKSAPAHILHLLSGLCVAACRQKRRVRFTTAAALVNELVEAKHQLQLRRVMARWSPTPDVAPRGQGRPMKASRKAKAPTGEKTAKAPRAESKTSRVIEMLKREGGVTLEERS